VVHQQESGLGFVENEVEDAADATLLELFFELVALAGL
jgi:hypothetical protein